MNAKIQEDAIAEAELALKNAMEGLRNSTDVDISALTEEEEYEDTTKREAMQIILENQDQFEPEVVDKALEDLNSSMHKPLVSQEELDAVDNEYGLGNESVNDISEEIDDMLNNPLGDYLN